MSDIDMTRMQHAAMPTEFKVLTQKDKWFSGKFDPALLEQAINAYSRDGWRVRSSVTASFPGFFSTNREEILLVLERNADRTLLEYKVLTQKDKWFSQKFDPSTLEKALNAYATEGWLVVCCATASIPGLFGAHREEVIVIMQRSAY